MKDKRRQDGAGLPVVVVGGGPAGMMAAVRAAQQGVPVVLFEKNAAPGRKLLLTGKGRCNVTNAEDDLKEFLRRYGCGGDFLRDAFKNFFNRDLMRFFEERGVKLKVERQKRVFPVADRSAVIVEALRRELAASRVRVVLRAEVKDLIVDNGRVLGVVLADGTRQDASAVVWATGGASYPLTGSTGEGIACAGRWGHRLVALRPGLVGLETRQRFPRDLSGMALKNIRLCFYCGKKKVVSEIGELLFTEFGISGPLVFTHSGTVADWLHARKPVTVAVDLKPAVSTADLAHRLEKNIQASPRRKVKTLLKEYLPLRFVEEFLKAVQVDPDEESVRLGARDRQAIVARLKDFRLEITRPRSFREAMVTRGGVSLKDIDPRTMQSRLVRGLYFAGEMIDIDGDTGGFNLQAAFSTGLLAGQNAAQTET